MTISQPQQNCCEYDFCILSECQLKQQLLALLPQGLAWKIQSGSVQDSFWGAVNAVFYSLTERLCDLVKELDVCNANELLNDWAELLGVPDDCFASCGDNYCFPAGQDNNVIEPDILSEICSKMLLHGLECCDVNFIKLVATNFGLDIEVTQICSDQEREEFTTNCVYSNCANSLPVGDCGLAVSCSNGSYSNCTLSCGTSDINYTCNGTVESCLPAQDCISSTIYIKILNTVEKFDTYSNCTHSNSYLCYEKGLQEFTCFAEKYFPAHLQLSICQNN